MHNGFSKYMQISRLRMKDPACAGFGHFTDLNELGFMRMLRDVSKRRQVHPTEARIALSEEIVIVNFIDGGRARDG
jgi:hypothetical protein